MSFVRCRIVMIGLVLLLTGYCLPARLLAQGFGPARRIVVFDTTVVNERAQEAIIRGVGGVILKPLRLVNGMAVVLPETAERALASRADVVRIDDDIEIYATAKKPGPSGQTTPWGIARVKAPSAWPISRGDGVKVAILDTGIQMDHPDLALNIAGGYNAISPGASPSDGNGHGTHVAGTVAAIDNTIGVVGVAPLAKLYAVKVLGNGGSGSLSDLVEGLDWCIQNGIQIVNMSLGASVDNPTFYQAIATSYQAGIVLVGAAGNNGGRRGTGAVDYPAAYPEVIAVSAIDENNEFPTFSSAGPQVDLAAPGVSILSTYIRGGYATMSGTSMAAPHVTGAAALRLAECPWESPDQVEIALKSTAFNLGLPANRQGAGLVDAYAALLFGGGVPPP